MHRKNVSFVTIGFLDILDLNLKNMFVINVMVFLPIAHSLKDTAILSAKGTTFRYILMGVGKSEALKRLNNSVTYDRGILL